MVGLFGVDIMQVIKPLVGGVLIGIGACLLLLLNGRILGVSGIVSGFLFGDSSAYRPAYLASLLGLLCAGLVFAILLPDTFSADIDSPLIRFAIAGMLVGFGMQLANGCTSGHGVCGVARLSTRSIIATAAFMIAGIATVATMRVMGVLS